MIRRVLFVLLAGVTILLAHTTLAPLTLRTALATASGASVPQGTIAYSTGGAVRLIEPDGSNDRLLWSSPNPSENGIPSVEWNEAGTEIAFISDHEGSVSFYERDVFAIAPDGSGLRKLTNAPLHENLTTLPTGSVTVQVQMTLSGGGPYLVYVAGAQDPQTVPGTPGTYALTFHQVADFGATLQPVVAIEGQYRWFNAAMADVQPGQTVDAGTLTVSGSGFWHFGVHENKLTWRHDDSRLGFIFGPSCEMKATVAQPDPGVQDEVLLEPAVNGYTCLVDWAPTAARANQLLYTESDFSSGMGHIYLTEEGSTAAGDAIINYALPATILDLEWLPDGSGFLFSYMDEFNSSANIYAYTWGATDVTPLTSFADEFAARFSLSPDGQHVVFERASDVEGAVDLWLMDSEGNDMRLLVQNAGRPSWGQAASAPPPPPPPTGDEWIYIPVVRKP